MTVQGEAAEPTAPAHAEDLTSSRPATSTAYVRGGERAADRQSGGLHLEGPREDITERGIANFRKADADYGKRLELAVQALRG